MAIGPILREARQKKQLTTSQVAEMTRMKVQIVDDLENDDFHRIAATIYGKGFIKLFAECVELDPEPLLADYMSQVGSPTPQKLPVPPEPQTSTPTPAATATTPESDTSADTAPADDLFTYASKPKQFPPPAAAGRDRPPTTRKTTIATHLPDLSTIPKTLHEIYTNARTQLTKWGDAIIRKITETGTHDKWIQRGLLAFGILVVILILIPLARVLFSRSTPAPLPDDELILFVTPPEPYLE
ncbi:MAG: helix-turn-helix domain-containing protein [Kiritimatiellia bacterium]